MIEYLVKRDSMDNDRIDELIKDRELGKENNKKELAKGGYAFDTEVINLFNSISCVELKGILRQKKIY